MEGVCQTDRSVAIRSLCLPDNAHALVQVAMKTSQREELERILTHSRVKNLFVLHYAAAIGDRAFFGLLPTFLPRESLQRELHVRNHFGKTPFEAAVLFTLLVNEMEYCLREPAIQSEHSSSVFATPKPLRVSPFSQRYHICATSRPTIGETLRENSVYYAASNAVYVEQTSVDGLETLANDHELLVFSHF